MKKINQEILQLAVPNILSNISVPLLSSVDTALMGHEGDASYIGAVGLASMVFNLIYWGFGFLRMGTTGMTAQSFGKNDGKEMISIFGRGMMVAGFIASLLIIFQIPIGNISMYLVGVGEDTNMLVQEYFNIRIWAAPAALGLMVLMGWFFGMQNAIYPLYLTLIINMVNIIFSWIFVRQYNMGIEGVAYGTVIAQYVGIIFGLLLFLRKYKSYLSNLSLGLIMQTEKLKAFFILNRDIFIRTVCLIIAFGFFYNRSSFLGVTMLAVNQVFMQYVNWMSYGVDGFAFAAESLVGKYEGANDSVKKRQAIKASFVWGGAFALLYAIIFLVGGQGLLEIFTDKPDVIQAGVEFLPWIILFPVLGFASYIWDGIFIGLTASRAMRDTMFLSMLAFIASYYIFESFGNHGLWMAMLVYVGVRGILQTLWYRMEWGSNSFS